MMHISEILPGVLAELGLEHLIPPPPLRVEWGALADPEEVDEPEAKDAA